MQGMSPEGDVPAPSFNVIGHVSGNLGLSVTARCVVQLLQTRGFPVAIWDVDPGLNRRGQDLTYERETLSAGDRLPHAINLFVLPPPALVELLRQNAWLLMEPHSFNVGFCPWELPLMPSSWIEWLESLDVLVAESEFIRSTFANQLSNVPIVSARHPLYLPADVGPSRSRFGLPDDAVLFVTGFEPYSDPQRKNPFAVIDAFRGAFGHDERTQLIVRVNNARAEGRSHPVLQSLRERAGGDPRIRLLEDTFSYADVLSLYASCDVFVSLHRAEGLGLGPLEAMALGKPVIATAWSGNMTYMNYVNSCPVRYRLVPAHGDQSQYQRETVGDSVRWADPDVAEAAAWMRRLASDTALREAIGRRAASDIAAFVEDAAQGCFVDEVVAVWRHRAFLGSRGPEEERKAAMFRWALRVAEGNVASAIRLDAGNDATMIAIGAAATGVAWDIQLNQLRMKVRAGASYSLAFEARADARRTIFVAVSMGRAPWSGLGLYREVTVSTEWELFEVEFVATDDESNARIHFDVGHAGDSVSVAAVALRDLSTGREVQPDLIGPCVIPGAPPSE